MSWFGVKKRFWFWLKNRTPLRWRPFFFFIFYFFGDHLFLGWKNVWISDFGRKIRLNFGEDLFFLGDHLFLGGKIGLNFRAFWEIPTPFLDKPCETDSKTMKIRVKVVGTFLTLSKKPPPFPIPGYAPEHDNIWVVVLFPQLSVVFFPQLSLISDLTQCIFWIKFNMENMDQN